MKYWLAAILVLLLGGQAQAHDATFPLAHVEPDPQHLEYNKTVTDQEIKAWFELVLKHAPEDLAQFRNQSTEERQLFLREHRRAYNEALIQIPTLRGLTDEELAQLEQAVKRQAEESVKVRDANERLRNYSPEEYKAIREAAVQLIQDFKAKGSKVLGRQAIQSDFPEALAFIEPAFIYVSADNCMIFLQKGRGRGIGYSVELSDEGEASMASFNHYEDWESTPIDLK